MLNRKHYFHFCVSISRSMNKNINSAAIDKNEKCKTLNYSVHVRLRQIFLGDINPKSYLY